MQLPIQGHYRKHEGQAELPAGDGGGCCHHSAVVGAVVTAAAAKELQGKASPETEERLQRRLQEAEEGEANEEEGGERCPHYLFRPAFPAPAAGTAGRPC